MLGSMKPCNTRSRYCSGYNAHQHHVKAPTQENLLAQGESAHQRTVDTAWLAGIMHRDLKPSNVLLNHLGWVKLADFGLARPLDGGERPQYTHTVATRWYRAPELLYGARHYGPAVDLWAAGLIFAEMIGGCCWRHSPSRHVAGLRISYQMLFGAAAEVPLQGLHRCCA